MKLFSISIMAAAAISLAPSLDMSAATPQITERSLVFNKGDYDSKFYRIPAIDVTADGTIIALADKRIDSNADLPGRIDVVCRTSSDNGKTWSPYIDVAVHDENGGYGDPALIVDKVTGDVICVATHGQGLWQAKGNGDYARIVTMRSKDNGKTWSKPKDITDQIFSNDGSNNTAKGITSFATSGRMLQTKDGRLMFALVVREPNENGWTPLYIYTIYSDDHGDTWKAVPVPTDKEADESKLVELPDGTLLMSIRNRRNPGHRKFSRSTDGGMTWSEAVVAETLLDPACNGDVIAAKDPDGKPVLYHTVPADLKDRKNVTLSKSYDGGYTWEPVISVCPGPSAYSSIVMLPDGSIGCLTEEDADDGGFRLWFSKIEL